jgi:hypothetical protein
VADVSQGRLFAAGEVPTAALDPVLAFDPGVTTNAQRVLDLARLGYLPEPVLDPTYGFGGMWADHQPWHLVACDVDRRRARDVRCDMTALPFRDRSFGSCLLDPPYKMTGDSSTEARGRTSNHAELADRFATTATRRSWRVTLEVAMVECMRVTMRTLVVKCQDQIDSGYEWQTGEVVLIGTAHRWKLEDMIHLSNTISQPPGRQVHARRNYSTFVVLRR